MNDKKFSNVDKKLLNDWLLDNVSEIKLEEYVKNNNITISDKQIKEFNVSKPYILDLINRKQKTINQHHIPQFYLKKFINSDWKLETFSVKTWKIIRPQIPKKICSWDYYYSFYEWKEDIISEMIEDLLWKYEISFSKIYDNLTSEILWNQLPSDKNIYKLCEFVSLSWLRWKKFREHLMEMEKDFIKTNMKTSYFMKKEKKCLPKDFNNISDNKNLENMLSTWEFDINNISNEQHLNFINPDNINQFANMLFYKKIRFYIADWEKKFITSDNSVIEIMPLENFNSFLWNSFFDRVHYFVLSPNILVEFYSPNKPWKKTKRKRLNSSEILYYNFLRMQFPEYCYSNDKNNFIMEDYRKMILDRCEDLSKIFTDFKEMNCEKLKKIRFVS